MVKPNLKVGDVFEDGGLYYKVLAVEGNRYRSKRVEKPEETTKRVKSGNKNKEKDQQDVEKPEETTDVPADEENKESEGES